VEAASKLLPERTDYELICPSVLEQAVRRVYASKAHTLYLEMSSLFQTRLITRIVKRQGAFVFENGNVIPDLSPLVFRLLPLSAICLLYFNTYSCLDIYLAYFICSVSFVPASRSPESISKHELGHSATARTGTDLPSHATVLLQHYST